MRWLFELFGIAPVGISQALRERDKALIVSYLKAYGPRSVLYIASGMDELTRGEHDWTLRDDREIHGLLRELENDGAVRSKTDNIFGRIYELVAPDKLLEVDL